MTICCVAFGIRARSRTRVRSLLPSRPWCPTCTLSSSSGLASHPFCCLHQRLLIMHSVQQTKKVGQRNRPKLATPKGLHFDTYILYVDMQPLRGSVVVATSVPKLHLQARCRSPSGEAWVIRPCNPFGVFSFWGAYRRGIFEDPFLSFDGMEICHLTEWKYVIWRDGNMSFDGMEICHLQG